MDSFDSLYSEVRNFNLSFLLERSVSVALEETIFYPQGIEPPESILKEYEMENKNTKRHPKKETNRTIRVSESHSKSCMRLKNYYTKTKKAKGKITFDPIINLAIDLLNEDHIKILQNDALKNSDREEIFRQKYFELYNTSSKEDFIGFTQTSAYFEFITAHGHLVS